MIEIDPDAQEYLLQGSIPGQSLTNSKEAPYAWEQPPRYTSVKEATEVIFFEMLKDENLETLSTMMMDGVPITDIAQILLTVGFQKGQWNADLLVTLIEPTIYLLLAIAERMGIDAELDRPEDRDPVDAASDEEAEEDIELNSKPNISAKEEVFKAANVNPASVKGLEIQKRLEDINPEEIKQSILERRKDDTPPSLLSRPEEN